MIRESIIAYRNLYFLIFTCLFWTSNPTFSQELAPSSLEIVNPNPVGSGARALGQGNAFVAIADDATAASWNPGGLSHLERPELSFALEAISWRATMDVESKESDSLSLQDLNYASLVLPFYYKTNMAFSLNYLKLFRFDKNFNVPFILSEISQENNSDFSIIGNYEFDQDGSFAVLAPAFGIDIIPKLSLGVTVNLWSHDLTRSSSFEKKEVTISNAIINGDPLAINTVVEQNRFEVDGGHSFVVGGIYRFSKAWTFAGVLKPSFTLDLDHIRTVENFRNKTDPRLEFPWIIGLGTAWRPNDSMTVAVDMTWTQWSEYTFEENGKSVNPLNGADVNIDELNDTYTLRLGGEYLWVKKKFIVSQRWGAGYDPTPAIDGVDDFYTVNFGLGIQLLKKVSFDIAYEFRWGNNVNGDTLQDLDATQDIKRHRVLASMIYYF